MKIFDARGRTLTLMLDQLLLDDAADADADADDGSQTPQGDTSGRREVYKALIASDRVNIIAFILIC